MSIKVVWVMKLKVKCVLLVMIVISLPTIVQSSSETYPTPYWRVTEGERRIYRLTEYFNITNEGNKTQMHAKIEKQNGSVLEIVLDKGTDIEITFTFIGDTDWPVGTIKFQQTEISDAVLKIGPQIFIRRTTENISYWGDILGYNIDNDNASNYAAYSTGEFMRHTEYIKVDTKTGWIWLYNHTYSRNGYLNYKYEFLCIKVLPRLTTVNILDDISNFNWVSILFFLFISGLLILVYKQTHPP